MYTKTLSTVSQNELDLVGQHAADLALLAEHKVPVPHSFIVCSTAFDTIVAENNLKNKIDFLLSHIEGSDSLPNVYTSVRKAVNSATLPAGFETEVQELFDTISTPGVGLSDKKLPVRLILSTNSIENPENNDTIIQEVNGFSECLLALRELWALAYHPAQLGRRIAEKFNEKGLKVAVIVQIMEKPLTSVHVYSEMPQDTKKLYVQAYYGYPDLRDRVTKDYYAVGKENLHVVLRELHEQKYKLDITSEGLTLVATGGKNEHDKVIKRHVEEVCRLTKKASFILQSPVKAFLQNNNDTQELLWVKRIPASADAPTSVEPMPTVEVVDIEDTEPVPEEATAEEFVDMSALAAATEAPAYEPAPKPVREEPVYEAPVTPTVEETPAVHIPTGPKVESEETTVDTPGMKELEATATPVEEPVQEEPVYEAPVVKPVVTPTVEEESVTPVKEMEDTVQGEILTSSFNLVKGVVAQKYRDRFDEEASSLAEMAERLELKADVEILRTAEQAVKNNSPLTQDEYTRAADEISALLSNA